jgi:hypothetical protein
MGFEILNGFELTMRGNWQKFPQSHVGSSLIALKNYIYCCTSSKISQCLMEK